MTAHVRTREAPSVFAHAGAFLRRRDQERILHSDETGTRGNVGPLFEAQSAKAKKPRKYAAWKGFYTPGVSGRFPETPKTDQTLNRKTASEAPFLLGISAVWVIP